MLVEADVVFSFVERFGMYPIYTFEENNSPFVWTEVFLREINRHPEQIILHLWPMEKTVILGMLDRQLPDLESGLAVIRQNGYQPLVRNIGGLAVVADDGVLNFSLFLSNASKNKLDIKPAYQLMVDVVQAMLLDHDVMVEAYEIKDSYCPGNYDLSINGKKFAGLAQRRIKEGIVVSIYLSVCGNQHYRGQLIADFYSAGIGDKETVVTYPKVNPYAMANLSELCDTTFTVDDIKERLLMVLRQVTPSLSPYQLTADNLTDLTYFRDRAKEQVLR